MAVAYVRDAGLKVAASFEGTTNGSFASLPAVGNHVFVGVSLWRNGIGSLTDAVTDNQGNSYAEDREINGGDDTASLWSTKVATSSGTYTVTVDPSQTTGNYIAWTAVEFSGVIATTHLDQTGSTTTSSTSTDASVTATGENTTTGGVAIAVATINNDDTDINIGDTPPTGYTNIQVNENSNGYIGYSMVYKIYSSTETSSAQWSHDNVSQQGWSTIICTYKEAASGVTLSISVTPETTRVQGVKVR